MKAFRELKALAEKYGFRAAGRTTRGHYIWERNGYRVVTVSKLGDRRTLLNMTRHFRVGEEYDRNNGLRS